MKTLKTLPAALIPTLGYVAVFAVLSQDLVRILWLCLGLGLGYFTLLLDEMWLFKLYADKEKPYGGGLITRSVPFLFIFLALSIFVVTSSASLIGTGVILSMGSILALELWNARNNKEVFTAIFAPLHPEQFNDKQRQQGISLFITILVALLGWALFS